MSPDRTFRWQKVRGERSWPERAGSSQAFASLQDNIRSPEISLDRFHYSIIIEIWNKRGRRTNEKGSRTHHPLCRHVCRHGNRIAPADHATAALRLSRRHGGGRDPGRTGNLSLQPVASFGQAEE